MIQRALTVALVCVACGEAPSSSVAPEASTSPPVGFAPNAGTWLWPCGGMSTVSPDQCSALARQYIDAVRAAQSCMPGDACAWRRPVGGYDTSGHAFLCSCTAAVNPTRAQEVDRMLEAFYVGGCAVSCCPCPSGPPLDDSASCIDGRCR